VEIALGGVLHEDVDVVVVCEGVVEFYYMGVAHLAEHLHLGAGFSSALTLPYPDVTFTALTWIFFRANDSRVFTSATR
jgi:hypothetical protein